MAFLSPSALSWNAENRVEGKALDTIPWKRYRLLFLVSIIFHYPK